MGLPSARSIHTWVRPQPVTHVRTAARPPMHPQIRTSQAAAKPQDFVNSIKHEEMSPYGEMELTLGLKKKPNPGFNPKP